MKMRKTISVMTAVIMLLVSVPLSGAGSRLPESPAARAHEEILNTPGGFFAFSEVDPAYPMTDETDETGAFVRSGNAGVRRSVSGVSTEPVYLSAGETVSFRYWYDTEVNFDFFYFSVNGDVVLQLSGNSGGWLDYSYAVAEAGEYSFEWKFTKDGRTDTGEDCIKLASVSYSGAAEPYFTRAAVKAGAGSAPVLSVVNGESPFGVKRSSSSYHPLYVYSENRGVPDSVSGFTAEVWLKEGWELGFDYAIQTEEDGDFFVFDYVLCDEPVEVLRLSGSDDYYWRSSVFTAPFDGHYTFRWRYEKNDSVDVGQDVVCIDNITVSGDVYGSAAALIGETDAFGLRFNTPSGANAFRFAGDGFVNDCRWVDSGVSVLASLVNMDAGETLSFDYSVSCAPGDCFSFAVNGETVLTVSGLDPAERSFVFTAPERGAYDLRWIYAKDGSGSAGLDRVLIGNIAYDGSFGQSLELASCVNAEDSEIGLVSDTDPGFEPMVLGSGFCAVSRNSWFFGTESRLVSEPVEAEAGQAVYFDFRVDSGDSSGSLTFRVLSGDETVHEAVLPAGEWDSYSCTFFEAMTVSFEWVYSAGDTVDFSAADRAYVAELRIGEASPDTTPEPTSEPTPEPTSEPTPEPTEPPVFVPGDANGDGSADVSDALLVLRFSMGIVEALPVPAAADVNGDGTVNVTDALQILRAAMGLIQL